MDKFDREMRDAIMKEVVKKARAALPLITPKVALEIRRAILATPAVQSMLGGQLQSEFGFVEPNTIVKKLLDAVEASIEVSVTEKPAQVEIILDKDKLMSTGVGEFKTKNGEVPWLEWLLSSGGRVVIVGWSIEYGAFPKKSRFSGSRSGKARMVPGGTYSVQKFAGTEARNFMTESIDAQTRNEIAKVIAEALK